ncbi:MAG: hypothetical protein V2I82_10890 [Halieaceae bacterium]|jgi:hypothetical protein|nr:hypothetical protein [Halieaceae bacterium]
MAFVPPRFFSLIDHSSGPKGTPLIGYRKAWRTHHFHRLDAVVLDHDVDGAGGANLRRVRSRKHSFFGQQAQPAVTTLPGSR